MLNHPSLAERLPNGLIATNDDYHGPLPKSVKVRIPEG
jgi:hypothetical protein